MKERDAAEGTRPRRGFAKRRPRQWPVVLQTPGEPDAELRCEQREGHEGRHVDYRRWGLNGPAAWHDGEQPWRDGWQVHAATAAALIILIAGGATCGVW